MLKPVGVGTDGNPNAAFVMNNPSHEPIPLEDALRTAARPADDSRPRMPEPLPVRLMTVEDARLVGAVGLEKELDQFYVALLGFERNETQGNLIYQAENLRLIFEVLEPPDRPHRYAGRWEFEICHFIKKRDRKQKADRRSRSNMCG